MEKELEIRGRNCHLWQFGTEGVTVFWPFSLRDETILREMDKQLSEQLADFGVQVLAFEVGDWFRDLSPWQAETPDGGTFTGKGADTLSWVTQEAIPWTQEYTNNYVNHYAMAGYSLAGLFSLWAMYETQSFADCASCSGSLWFPGWDTYVANHHAPENSFVYLSLGGKEPNSNNKIMSTIGDKTKKQDQMLAADPGVKNHIFEWNSGGHFANAEKRVVKGIRWLLENRNKA